jgi:hypothetical protein
VCVCELQILLDGEVSFCLMVKTFCITRSSNLLGLLRHMFTTAVLWNVVDTIHARDVS